MKKLGFPIIHIIGLPGAGKTTLGKKLSAKYHLPVFYIGAYRSKFPSSDKGEADAWVALFRDLSRQKWANCILETTGLNSRERFLRAAFPFSNIVTIKLIAQKRVLYKRIGKKKNERGGEWLFSDDYSDKYEFVRKMFRQFIDGRNRFGDLRRYFRLNGCLCIQGRSFCTMSRETESQNKNEGCQYECSMLVSSEHGLECHNTLHSKHFLFTPV